MARPTPPPQPPADAPPNPSGPSPTGAPTFRIEIDRGDFYDGNYRWAAMQSGDRWMGNGATMTRWGALRQARRAARKRAHRLAIDGTVHTETYTPPAGG